MAIANKETPVGQELPPLHKVVKFENMRLFSMWTNLNMHSDWGVAKKSGLPAPIGQGLMTHAYISEMCANFFGKTWLETGKVDIRFLQYILPGDRLTVGGTVRERTPEGDAIRLKCEVWCENQAMNKVCVGTVSAVVH